MMILYVVYLSLVHWMFAAASLNSMNDSEGPLLLTPYINSGQLKKARTLSHVQPPFDNIQSYSGFLTVDEPNKSNLFFWYFPKNGSSDGGNEPKNSTSPLILWLGGGPGMTSLVGLFQGTGPYYVKIANNSTLCLKTNQFTWTKNYHMLYIDQPVGTGFSFTAVNTSVTTTGQAVDQLYIALQQFYTLFPELRNHDFYLAGESYAGKYIPAFGLKLHRANEQTPARDRVHLKGMIIGDGLIDPENMLDVDELMHAAGLIDRNEQKVFKEYQTDTKRMIQSGNWLQAYDYLYDLIFLALPAFTGASDYYDYRRGDEAETYFDVAGFVEHVTSDQMRKRIHVHQVKYTTFSLEVAELFKPDTMKTGRPVIEELLTLDYPMLFYNGQYDIVCAPHLTEKSLDVLRWRGARDFSEAKKQFWHENNKLLGFYKAVENLVFLTVRNGGHSVTLQCPKTARNMVDKFIGREFRQQAERVLKSGE